MITKPLKTELLRLNRCNHSHKWHKIIYQSPVSLERSKIKCFILTISRSRTSDPQSIVDVNELLLREDTLQDNCCLLKLINHLGVPVTVHIYTALTAWNF